MGCVILGLEVQWKKMTTVDGGDEVLCRTSWQNGQEFPSSAGEPCAMLAAIVAGERRFSDSSE
jgi:hypothetical protein